MTRVLEPSTGQLSVYFFTWGVFFFFFILFSLFGSGWAFFDSIDLFRVQSSLPLLSPIHLQAHPVIFKSQLLLLFFSF